MRTARQTLTLTRVFAASREEVFAAWTTPESVRQWMRPGSAEVVLAELDLRVGGTFRIDMLHEGERLIHSGVYREIVPPEKLVFTWTSRDTHQHETLVGVELRALGNRTTELTLTQTLLPDVESAERHTRGWSLILEHLASYVRHR